MCSFIYTAVIESSIVKNYNKYNISMFLICKPFLLIEIVYINIIIAYDIVFILFKTNNNVTIEDVHVYCHGTIVYIITIILHIHYIYDN
jgi:hypothetical protein